MPIKDYEKEYKLVEALFHKNPKVSAKNKAYVKSFIEQYHKRPATKSIFFKHINELLEQTEDLKNDMNDTKKMSKIWSTLYKDLSPNYYNTVKKVGNVLAKWLNDGNKPKGFENAPKVSKSDQKRDLRPEDMITWEEGLKMANATTSIQLKAIVLLQLDAGFRPSEFVDLNYGDVTVKDDVVVFHIKQGKTGSRDVICHRSVPYFLKWYHSHPAKNKNDPLWIMENTEKSFTKEKKQYRIKKYEYNAIKKRIMALAKRVGLKKPVDLYNMRHSSCVLDKKDNLPLDLSADRHGHSSQFFIEVYGRLDVDSNVKRYNKHYGKEEEKIEKPKTNITCSRCTFCNEPDADFCFRCGTALSLQVALNKEEQLKQSILEELKKVIEAKKQA